MEPRASDPGGRQAPDSQGGRYAGTLAAGGALEGRVVAVVVGWAIDTPDGPRKSAMDLATMRRHCRAERVEDLLDDLTLLCQDVQDAREAQEDRRTAPMRSVQ